MIRRRYRRELGRVGLHADRRRAGFAFGATLIALAVSLSLQPARVVTPSTWISTVLALTVAWLAGEKVRDVVAHSMSVIAVQAGVANHVIDSRPELARQALATVETNTPRRRWSSVIPVLPW
jgi:Histidine kinase